MGLLSWPHAASLSQRGPQLWPGGLVLQPQLQVLLPESGQQCWQMWTQGAQASASLVVQMLKLSLHLRHKQSKVPCQTCSPLQAGTRQQGCAVVHQQLRLDNSDAGVMRHTTHTTCNPAAPKSTCAGLVKPQANRQQLAVLPVRRLQQCHAQSTSRHTMQLPRHQFRMHKMRACWQHQSRPAHLALGRLGWRQWLSAGHHPHCHAQWRSSRPPGATAPTPLQPSCCCLGALQALWASG